MKISRRQLTLITALLLVIAGTALAAGVYTYVCNWPTCGLVQQFSVSKGAVLKCPQCGHMMQLRQ